MEKSGDLFILWTSADPITAQKMVFMYGLNGLNQGWWENVTIIIWGASAKLVAENQEIKSSITNLIAAGVSFSACKACAKQLGVVDILESLGIEVKYWGEPLTNILKSDATLLTI